MKRIISIIIIMLTTAGSAAAIDLTRNDGQITVELRHGTTILGNVDLSLYRVADVDASGNFTLVSAFAGSGVNLDVSSTGNSGIDAGVNRTLSNALLTYATTNNISRTQGRTNNSGVAVFSGLTPGMYLIAQTNSGGANGYTMQSALIQLPTFDNSVWVYRITSDPKIEPPSTRPSRPTRPTTPTTPTDPAVDIPPEDVPQVAPGDPDPVDPTVPDDEIIDPKPPLADLPQTGQLRWPIPMLAALGMLMTITGAWMINRKKRKQLKAALAMFLAGKL